MYSRSYGQPKDMAENTEQSDNYGGVAYLRENVTPERPADTDETSGLKNPCDCENDTVSDPGNIKKQSVRRLKFSRRRSLPEPDDERPPVDNTPEYNVPECEKCHPKPHRKELCPEDLILIGLIILLMCEGSEDELILIFALLLFV